MSEQDESYSWVIDACLDSDSLDPSDLLEQLMADSRCVAFGPIHHFLVGAALLTCFRNAQMGQADQRRDQLLQDLVELGLRSSNVPGAACARWGVCGAAASTGMAYAIIRDNGPVKKEGWSEGQHMVADILNDIADAGAPRCCKRDSRIAVRQATVWFNKLLDGPRKLAFPSKNPVCSVYDKNTVCLQQACPYHPKHES